jgi:hypothetical protein
MRDPLLLAGRHLVGADVETSIDRGRIAGDHFPAEAFRQRNPERTLSGGGGSDDGEKKRLEGRHLQRAIKRQRRQQGEQDQKAKLLRAIRHGSIKDTPPGRCTFERSTPGLTSAFR